MKLSGTDKRTSRHFGINTTYSHLVEVLGEPERYNERGLKIDAEWQVEDEEGRVLNVWNYKNGPNYNYDSDRGKPVEDIERWSAGGSRELAEQLGLVEP